MAEVPPAAPQRPTGVYAARAAGEAQLVVPVPNWTLFRALPDYDLVNGDIDLITPILIKATIETAYHWVPVAGVTPINANRCMDAYIRSHHAYLMNNRPANRTDAQIRKLAIILGCMRAGSTTFYRLAATDLIPGETTDALLEMYEDPQTGMRFRPTAAASSLHGDELTADLNFNHEEQAVICALATCSAGAIPMQGYSLMMHGHHYLSGGDGSARKPYAVVERAYWRSPDVGEWFTSDEDMVRDAVWHKATHPVMLRLKTSISQDITIATRLGNAGSGACASRLPALEPDLRAAGSHITLFATVRPMMIGGDGGIDCSLLEDLVAIAKSLPVDAVDPPINRPLPPRYAKVVKDRKSAVKVVAEILERNRDKAAYCFGFYCALSDNSLSLGGGTSGGTDTLKTSHSLTRLRGSSYASYVGGVMAYQDYQAARNRLRQDCVFEAPKMLVE